MDKRLQQVPDPSASDSRDIPSPVAHLHAQAIGGLSVEKIDALSAHTLQIFEHIR